MKQKLLNIYFNFFGILAKIYINKQKPFVIWITGSIWKTSCRMIVSEILQKHLPEKIIYTSSKNFNWELWMSLNILWIWNYEPQILSILKTIFSSIKRSLFWKKFYDIIVLEYGIDHIWEMDFLLSIVKPNIWILTKIDKVHSSQFKSKEIIANEKYKLLQNTLDFCFLNIDDEFSKKYENTINCKNYYFSTNNNFFSLIKEKNEIKNSFNLIIDDKKTTIQTNLIWKENIWYIEIWYNILQKVFDKHFDKVVLELTLQPSRFGIFEWIYDSILIDSSYNASPESMNTVIENTKIYAEKLYSEYSLILCLWEMRELWEYTKQEHEKLAKYTSWLTQNIFIIWESMKKYFLPLSKNALYFKNSQIFWKYLKEFLKKSDKKYLILFKWSQNTIFLEEAIKQVLKNSKDTTKICRQEDFWIEKKFEFFKKAI